MKRTFAVMTVLALACAAHAQISYTSTSSWEPNPVGDDSVGLYPGDHAALGHYPDFTGSTAADFFVTDAEAHTGDQSLQVWETGTSGTPQVYAGYAEGLNDGDQVEMSFWVKDPNEGNPSLRIWAHYTSNDAPHTLTTIPFSTDDDIQAYAGSASGNYTYSDGDWHLLTYNFAFDKSTDRTGVVLEIRPYGYDGAEDNWVDDVALTVTTTSTDGFVMTPNDVQTFVPEPATMALLGLGGLGALVRRRRRA